MSQYYYSDGTDRHGPFSVEELRQHNLKPETPVWKEGLPDWVPANTLADLQVLFDSSAAFTPPVAAPGNPMAYTPPPKNWLIESILVTIFCCLPLGIVGIIHATKVESLWNTGQHDAAIKSSQDAAKWVKIGFFVGLAVYILYGLLMVLGMAAGLTAAG